MRSVSMLLNSCLVGILLFLLAGCDADENQATVPLASDSMTNSELDSRLTAPAESPSAAWQTFVDDYIESYLEAHPAWAVAMGRHEFDGLLPDWSAAGIAAEIARLKAAKQASLEFDRADLGELGEYQRDYLVSAIDRSLFWMDKAEWPFVNPAFYFD